LSPADLDIRRKWERGETRPTVDGQCRATLSGGSEKKLLKSPHCRRWNHLSYLAMRNSRPAQMGAEVSILRTRVRALMTNKVFEPESQLSI
jgi:hypothetical protein